MLCPLCQFDNPSHAQRCRSCGAGASAGSSERGASVADALPDGTLLAGTYAVEGVLGQGGFGITYRCHDQMLDRRVAVKEFFPSGCRRRETEVQPSRGLSDANFRDARAQFLAEARVLARCHHAGIVGVHAAFEANGTAYMVMELLHGKTLAQLLTARGGRVNEAEAVGVIERIGAALQFVHELELLHRDIKPDNIMVCDDGRVMLIDFGTAREYIKDQAQGHTIVVTPGYAPLEQYARQARRGAFTDVYSLAATLYHLLTGQMPPAASDRAMGVVLRPVREENPRVSRSVARAVETALQMEVAKRPQSVREFLELMNAPVEEAEVEAYFAPQPSDLVREADEESSDQIPMALDPDVLRAQQQAWQNVMPSANVQPVQLAPPSVFSARAPPSPTTPAQMSVAGGNVRVKNAFGADNSAKSLLWMFGFLIVAVGFAVLIIPRSPQRNDPPPATQWSGSQSSRPNFSPPFIPPADQSNAKRHAAQRAWDALPILLPTSVESLPYSKGSGGKVTSWRGAVEFSPDGKRLAYVDDQAVLRVLSLPDRRVVRSLELDKSSIWKDILFSADNQTIAVTQMTKLKGYGQTEVPIEVPNRLDLWSVRSGKKLGAFSPDVKEAFVQPQAVFNDGRVLMLAREPEKQSELFLWDSKTAKRSDSPISVPDTAEWGYGVVSPDGKEFVLGDALGRLHWLDLRTGKQRNQNVTQMTGADYKAQFGSDTYLPGNQTNAPLGVRGIDYSLNGSYLASRNLGEINVFNSKAQKFASLPISSSNDMWFSIAPDGRWLAARGALPYGPSGNLLWNARTGQIIRLQAPSETLLDFGFSQDGKQLYGIFGKENHSQIVTWEVGDKPFQPTQIFAPNPTAFQFSTPGTAAPFPPVAQSSQTIAIAKYDFIEIRQPTGALVKNLSWGNIDAAAVEFSPEGQFLSARLSDGAVQLWNVKTGELVPQLKALKSASHSNTGTTIDPQNARDIAFSPDDNLFACVRFDGKSSAVELWSLKNTPRRLASFAQKEQVNALAFSPDSKSLICGGDKGLLQWYDVATRNAQSRIRIGEPVWDILFEAQSLLVMGDSTATLYRVPATSKQPLEQASKTKLPNSFSVSRDVFTQSVLSADGKLVATSQGNKAVQIWQLPSGLMSQSLPTEQHGVRTVSSLKFSADGARLTAVEQNAISPETYVTTWSRAQ